MAVVDSKELPIRTFNKTVSDGVLHISRTRSFVVRTDAFTDDEDIVLRAPIIPRVTDPHPSDSLVPCIGLSAAPMSNDPLTWQVTATYELRVPYLGAPDDPIVAPLDRPANESYSFTRATEEVTHTAEDPPRLIVNTAGETYDPPLQRETSRLVYTITKNFADFPLDQVLQFQDAINSAEWQGFPPGTLKFSIESVEHSFEAIQDQNFEYYRITMSFEYKPEGWQPVVTHVGYRYYDDQGNLVTAVDDNGVPLNQPVFLDANGHKADPGTAYVETIPIYKERDFNELGVP